MLTRCYPLFFQASLSFRDIAQKFKHQRMFIQAKKYEKIDPFESQVGMRSEGVEISPNRRLQVLDIISNFN
jgi:hypothetical protein